jgi:hypothetical protein
MDSELFRPVSVANMLALLVFMDQHHIVFAQRLRMRGAITS